ncbi:MAG: hypothetical protein K0S76_1912 [Herbinix sp.]|jgi:hypothetical protein|nr:hypothetical protein [Herbinix sp.]
MKALSYLLIRQLKNRILAIKKKPGLLILYLFIILMIVFSAVSIIIFDNDGAKPTFADERIMYLFIMGFGFMYLFLFINSGLSTGSTLFSMADVGLLFVAPISSKKILIYGLISTMGKALLAAIFILYQVGNLKVQFGYGLKEILALFIIYAMIVLFSQLISIAIYIYSNGNPFRKKLVKTILYLSVLALILSVYLIKIKEQTGLFDAVLRMIDSKWFGYVPVAGWATMFFQGVANGILINVFISAGLFLVVGILVIALLTIGTADYYEDVLISTEVTFQMLRAAKEGRNVPRRTNKKIKIRDEDMDLLKGSGAMTIAYKHILEMKRTSRFIFIDGYTLFITAGVGIAGYNFKNTMAAYGILAVAIYLQFFLTLLGRLKSELIKPYIFLIPEKSIYKVFAASVTSLLKPCVDGVIMFTALAIVRGADPLTCIFMALAYASSGAVFVGLTILYQRVLGGQPNKLVQMMIGMTLLLAVIAPAILMSVATAFLLPSYLDFLCTLPYSIFCTVFAYVMFLACGNLIEKSEYTGKI